MSCGAIKRFILSYSFVRDYRRKCVWVVATLQDAIPDARAKEARRLSQIRLRLGDDLHRREGAEELLARDGALGCM